MGGSTPKRAGEKAEKGEKWKAREDALKETHRNTKMERIRKKRRKANRRVEPPTPTTEPIEWDNKYGGGGTPARAGKGEGGSGKGSNALGRVQGDGSGPQADRRGDQATSS